MNEIVDAEGRPDLLPFEDAAVPAAMKRLVADPLLGDMARFAFPEIPVADIKEQLLHVASADEFQEVFVRPMLERILKKSCSSFTMGGLEHIDLSCGHLFMSDHRDIVLDGSLLQLALLRCDLPTSEITFGSNLISSPFVEDFGKCNKMYKILRGGSAVIWCAIPTSCRNTSGGWCATGAASGSRRGTAGPRTATTTPTRD